MAGRQETAHAGTPAARRESRVPSHGNDIRRIGRRIGRLSHEAGYEHRTEDKIEVVTEGVLTRLLVRNPELDGYGAISSTNFTNGVFRPIPACPRARNPTARAPRSSATRDVRDVECGPVSDLLGTAPVISCVGRMFPVDTRHLDCPLTGPLEAAIVQSIRRSLARDSGGLLVFLPGMAEIRRVERALLDADLGNDVVIAPLHGDLPQAAQDSAIEPGLAREKVVLATSIAETSLTIDGIRVVIDAGQLRAPRFDPRSGLDPPRDDPGHSGLGRPAERSSRPAGTRHLLPSLDRAGAPYAHGSPPPEILDADLSSVARHGAMGRVRPFELSWLTPRRPAPSRRPENSSPASARLMPPDGSHSWAADGRMPRLAHMLLRSVPLDCARLACDLALLSERDPLRAP